MRGASTITPSGVHLITSALSASNRASSFSLSHMQTLAGAASSFAREADTVSHHGSQCRRSVRHEVGSPTPRLSSEGRGNETLSYIKLQEPTMADNNIQSVLEKVKKLVALASGSVNENECAAARSAADRLMSEYRISQADLEVKGDIQSEPFARKAIHSGGKRIAWAEVVLRELCNHFGGYFFFESRRSGGNYGQGREGSKGNQSYTVVARESDLLVIEYFYTYLCEEVDRLSRFHARGNGLAFALAFRMGVAQGISAQFRELRAAARVVAQANAQSCALVLLDKRASEAEAETRRIVPGLRTGKGITGGRDQYARARGFEEGKKVQIRTGIGASGSSTPKLTQDGG